MNMLFNTTALQTIRLTWSDRQLIGFAGIDPELVRKFGTLSDVSAVRTRGVAELGLLIYAGSVMSIAADIVFGTPGSINPGFALGGFGMAFLLTRMDAYLHGRGLYHSGKQEVRKAGAQVGDHGEDVAFYAAVGARFGIGIAQATVVGTMAAQALFAPEISASFDQEDQQRNAPILAIHAQVEDDRLKDAKMAMKRAADEYASIKKNEEAVRAQDVGNLRSAVRQNARQQVKSGLEATSTLTTRSLQKYEDLSSAAEARSQAAAKTYADMLAGRNDAVRAAVVSDPRYVPTARGLLARLSAIKAIAKQDSWVAAGILLTDGIGIGIELWLFVLFLAQIPTQLAVSLYCQHKKRTSEAARDLVASLGQPLANALPASAPSEESSDAERDADLTDTSIDISALGSSMVIPARRPRGRPRKNPPNPNQAVDGTATDDGQP